MDVEREHARLDAGVRLHDAARLVDIAGEDAHPRHVRAVGDRADDREETGFPQREVPLAVAQDNACDLWRAAFARLEARPSLQDDDGVWARSLQRAEQLVVADLRQPVLVGIDQAASVRCSAGG